ncbi:MAG: ZIP family metal transporter [Candidatus Altiarchaeota archaeon]
MAVLVSILLSVLLISLISLVGVVSLAFRKKSLETVIQMLLAFASGSLIGAAFLDLIPEAVEEGGNSILSFVLWGILGFFIMEKFIHWHHCGKSECHVRPVAYLNLIGDGVHNFIDGIVVAAAYLSSIPTGIITTIAIALHEIPQEFGDFAVLLHFGLSRKKALFYNFLSASSSIVGAVLGYYFLNSIGSWIPNVIALAAGGFIYIATADLMPEIVPGSDFRRLIMQTTALLSGVFVIFFAGTLLPH